MRSWSIAYWATAAVLIVGTTMNVAIAANAITTGTSGELILSLIGTWMAFWAFVCLWLARVR